MFCIGCERRAKKGLLSKAKEAHEASIEATRREERVRLLQEVRGTLVQCCADFAAEEAHAGGLAHAVRCLEDLIAEKKGQAK